MTTETVIRPIDVPEFTARVDQANGGLKMEMVGNADLNVTAMLDRLVEEIHREACRLGVREVVVDLRALEFMNSSCLKSLVWWISSVHELAAAHQYHITFVSSPLMYWQRRSLSALAGLATELVSISA